MVPCRIGIWIFEYDGSCSTFSKKGFKEFIFRSWVNWYKNDTQWCAWIWWLSLNITNTIRAKPKYRNWNLACFKLSWVLTIDSFFPIHLYFRAYRIGQLLYNLYWIWRQVSYWYIDYICDPNQSAAKWYIWNCKVLSINIIVRSAQFRL